MDIGKAWRDGGLGKALKVCELACETFPEDYELKHAAAMLLEIAGRPEEALSRWDEIAARFAVEGPDEHILPYNSYRSFPQYRLKLQLGQYQEALKELETIGGQHVPKFFGEDPGFAAALGGYVKVEQAVLLADNLHQEARAYALLKEAETEIREVLQKKKKKKKLSLEGVLYRHCLYELARLADADKGMPIPQGVLNLPPLEIEVFSRANDQWAGMMLSVTAGDFAQPSFIENYNLSSSAWAGAVAEQTPSRTIKALCAYLAGGSALRRAKRPDLALKYFSLAAEVDTWIRPVAAAKAADVAATFADDILKQAAEKDAAYSPQFDLLRQRLADQLRGTPSDDTDDNALGPQ